jgi:hypothetical protein
MRMLLARSGRFSTLSPASPRVFVSLSYPLECTMPTPMQASQIRRRLSESSVDELAAERLASTGARERIVFDVLTTFDREMATVGAY